MMFSVRRQNSTLWRRAAGTTRRRFSICFAVCAKRARANSATPCAAASPTSLRDHLVMVHAPLVEHCARNFKASGEPLDDLVSGRLCRFNQSRGSFRPRKTDQIFDLRLPSHRRRNSALSARFGAPDSRAGLALRATPAHHQNRRRSGATDRARAHARTDRGSLWASKSRRCAKLLDRAQTLRVDSLDEPAGNEEDGAGALLERFDAGADAHRRGDEGRVEDSMFLEEALLQLKALEQQALTMFFFDELSKSEIARRLGISVNYSAYLIRRGTESLRRILENDRADSRRAVGGFGVGASAGARDLFARTRQKRRANRRAAHLSSARQNGRSGQKHDFEFDAVFRLDRRRGRARRALRRRVFRVLAANLATGFR